MSLSYRIKSGMTEVPFMTWKLGLLLFIAFAFCLVSVFVLNWFWALLAIPTVFIAVYDFIQVQKDRKRLPQKPVDQ